MTSVPPGAWGWKAAAAVAGAGLCAVQEGTHGAPVSGRRVPVDVLLPPVRCRVGRPRQVCGHDAQVLGVCVPHQPHEPRAEHGQRRGQELAPQRLDGAEVPL